jgi:hypothetical protein
MATVYAVANLTGNGSTASPFMPNIGAAVGNWALLAKKGTQCLIKFNGSTADVTTLSGVAGVTIVATEPLSSAIVKAIRNQGKSFDNPDLDENYYKI